MLLKGFPDFIEYNNTQAAKGRPKVSWPEFLRLRKAAAKLQDATQSLGALIRQEAATSLQEAVQGQSIKLLPLYPDSKEQPVAVSDGVYAALPLRAPEGLSEDILELTSEMEIDPEGRDAASLLLDTPECLQVHALCDGSGPIGSI